MAQTENIANTKEDLTKKVSVNLAKSLRATSDYLTRDDLDGGPVSLDEIEKGLWLGKIFLGSIYWKAILTTSFKATA